MWNETDEEYWNNTVDMRIDVKVKTGSITGECVVMGEYRETSGDADTAKDIGFELGYNLGDIAESLIEKLCGFRPEAYREAARQFADALNCAADSLERATVRVMEDIEDEKA